MNYGDTYIGFAETYSTVKRAIASTQLNPRKVSNEKVKET